MYLNSENLETYSLSNLLNLKEFSHFNSPKSKAILTYSTASSIGTLSLNLSFNSLIKLSSITNNIIVRKLGFEPKTNTLSVWCSNQLSYGYNTYPTACASSSSRFISISFSFANILSFFVISKFSTIFFSLISLNIS